MHLVSPTLPTVLNHQAAVDLPGYDLFIVHDVTNVHVLPGAIDLEKFKNALSNTLQMYPHAAGHIRCQDRHWSIELTNSCVPVDVSYARETTSSAVLKGNWVIQEALASLVYDQPVHTDLINGTAPLVRFKLTFFMEDTCIGITWNHVLGDGIVLFRFTHTLSQFYQNKAPEFATPTFQKHVFPPPSEAIAAEYYFLTHQLNTYITELGPKYAEVTKGVENVQWRFTGEELRRLHAITNSSEQQTLTIQDCLTAYLVTVLNRAREIPIPQITNVVSYRKVIAPFIEENVAGNTIRWIIADNLPLDMAGIAIAIRTSIIRSRDPQEIENWLSVMSHCLLTITNSGKSTLWAPYEDELVVNSNSSIDWCSAHFGFPDGSRFYTAGFWKDYLRAFKSNPVKGVDGVWHTRHGSIDISFGVPPELKPRILDILAEGFGRNSDVPVQPAA